MKLIVKNISYIFSVLLKNKYDHLREKYKYYYRKSDKNRANNYTTTSGRMRRNFLINNYSYSHLLEIFSLINKVRKHCLFHYE